MFGMGGTEIIVILIVALICLGPDKLPGAAKSISKGIRDIKKQSRMLQQTIENDEQIGGAIRDLKSALRGEDLPPSRTIQPKLAPKETEALASGVAAGTAVAAQNDDPEIEVAKDDQGHPITDAPETPIIAAGPKITLPEMAGEPDAETPAASDDDDDLASMVKPAPGTVAKGSEPHG